MGIEEQSDSCREVRAKKVSIGLVLYGCLRMIPMYEISVIASAINSG